MIRKVLFALAVLVAPSVAIAEFPYDSVCRVNAYSGASVSGGSGTLIALNETQGLVLCVRHVGEYPGQKVKCTWPNGETREGQVVAVNKSADLALMVVDKPEGVQPVPVAHATRETGPFVAVGYPGIDRQNRHWQQGAFVEADAGTLVYDARPIPGMSGGACFDRYGRVVGAVSAYGSQYGYCGDGDALGKLLEGWMTR